VKGLTAVHPDGKIEEFLHWVAPSLSSLEWRAWPLPLLLLPGSRLSVTLIACCMLASRSVA
jgi:hypothetical protein